MDRFRRAKEDDLDAILGMMQSYYQEDGYTFEHHVARAAARDLLRRGEYGGLWVAILHGHVVGYLAVTFGFSLQYQGRDAFIDELYIAENSRDQGLGSEALAIAETFCRENGVKAIHLEVERHRKKALELYRHRGFLDQDRCLMTKLLHNG